MDVRMVIGISDSGPNVDLFVPLVERETWVTTRLDASASIYTYPRKHSAAKPSWWRTVWLKPYKVRRVYSEVPKAVLPSFPPAEGL